MVYDTEYDKYVRLSQDRKIKQRTQNIPNCTTKTTKKSENLHFYQYQQSEESSITSTHLIISIIIIIIIILSFFATWTCPQQIWGTTGQNFMTLGGVIDICL